jgi:hypothetical protein
MQEAIYKYLLYIKYNVIFNIKKRKVIRGRTEGGLPFKETGRTGTIGAQLSDHLLV